MYKDLHAIAPRLLVPISDVGDFWAAMSQHVRITENIAFLYDNNKISLSMALYFSHDFAESLRYDTWMSNVFPDIEDKTPEEKTSEAITFLQNFCKNNNIEPLGEGVIPITKKRFLELHSKLTK